MVPEVSAVRQQGSFDRFRCTGAECEDTCCVGWGVPVDRRTYEKYRDLPEHRIAGRSLSSLVEINPAGSAAGNYAKLRLESGRCPAFHEGLCAIQQSLGEPYLPELCSKYPRVLNLIGGTLERSLDLSCPEAARLVLEDAAAAVFEDRVEEERPRSINLVASDPEGRLYQVRKLVIAWIQERSLPLGQRIVSLGFAIERVAGIEIADAVDVWEELLTGLRRGSFFDVLSAANGDSTFQLETVLDLVVARMGTDYTSPRFVECFRDFLHGLAWTPARDIEDLAASYDLAARCYFRPFVDRHERLLENYLINYVFRTVFPYRSKMAGREFAIDDSGESMRHCFDLLGVHYAIVRTMLIGMAARYREAFSMEHAVKLVQSYSRAFLHCSSFEAAAMESLGKNSSKVAALVMD